MLYVPNTQSEAEKVAVTSCGLMIKSTQCHLAVRMVTSAQCSRLPAAVEMPGGWR